jgi:hypothetical protein
MHRLHSLRKPVRVAAGSDVDDGNETSAARTIGSSDRIGNSPQISPSPGAARQHSDSLSRRMPESRFLFCASGSPTAHPVHDDQSSAWKIVSNVAPGFSGMLIKQHHTTKFTSDAPRGCQCRHGGVWQTLTQNKVVRYSFGISSPWQ